MNEASDYGLWSLVLLNSLLFIAFAFSFAKPQTTPVTGARSAPTRRSSSRC